VEDTNGKPVVTGEQCPKWTECAKGAYQDLPGMLLPICVALKAQLIEGVQGDDESEVEDLVGAS
jgi:hypothetical protein